MIYFRMLMVLLYSPVGIYYYFLFKRIIKYFIKKDISNLVKAFLGVISVLITVLSSNPFGIWIVIFSHFFVFSIFTDLIMFILRKLNKENKVISFIYNSSIVPTTLTIALLIFAYFNMINVISKTYDIETSKNLENDYKIVFLSDLHFGTTMDEEKLEKYSEEISSLNPDILILGGDIVDENTTKEQVVNAFNILGKIDSKYGVFFVYGNHDKSKYYTNKKHTDLELANIIEEAGITSLVDDNYMINNELILIGRDDFTFPKSAVRKKSSELVNGLFSDKFLLILDHHPYDLKENSKAGYDLQLSGHTHGGQIFPTGLVAELFDKDSLNYGYRKIDGFEVIVSSGIGGWAYPFRTGTNSEYLIINIRKK